MKKAESESAVAELLLNKDETALPQLFLFFAEDLLSFYLKEFTVFQNDSSDLEDVITDSLFYLSEQPEKFDPERASLKTFIFRDVKFNILNALRKKQSKKNNIQLNTVELTELHGNIIDDRGDQKNQDQVTDSIKKKIQDFFAELFPSKLDQTLAWMIEIEKVRETRMFGTILNIIDMNPIDQEILVKQHKDRIKAKLKRSGYVEFKKKLRSDA